MTSTPAPEVLEALAARGWTVAVAESLTGGMVVSSLVDVPAPAVVRVTSAGAHLLPRVHRIHAYIQER